MCMILTPEHEQTRVGTQSKTLQIILNHLLFSNHTKGLIFLYASISQAWGLMTGGVGEFIIKKINVSKESCIYVQ